MPGPSRPLPHLHAHSHGNGHYYHRSYGAAPPSLGHTGGERRLHVRVRQIRDAPVAILPSVSASGSGASPTSTSTLPSSRRGSHVEVVGAGAGVGAEMAVDTDDGEEGADTEVVEQ